uniref:Uncharacterized protein n=1 Tax=Hemiselmis andersenii TaxID=464988 RepID=A0A6T8JDT5_HEMAN|mmetsp:Transcript_176/g.472  ORF Transcript_176/g.472 Transcript_176/m.472 type:complete len:258 (+) Transcript_176:98-871(+)
MGTVLQIALILCCLPASSSFLLPAAPSLSHSVEASFCPSQRLARPRPTSVRSSTARRLPASTPVFMAESPIFTCEEVEEAANQCGMTISINFLGPYYRAVIRTLPAPGKEKGKAVGFTTGTMILDLLRQDTMRVSSVNNGNLVSRERLRKLKAERDWRVPTVYGVSLILGAYVGAYAFDKGCKTAELLAIKDDERQHAVLVRHYQRLGLKVVKILNNDIVCVPDKLIWGGEGSLMSVDIQTFLEKHTAEINRLRSGV